MIIKHFDQGWYGIKAAEIQNKIVKTYFEKYFNDDSRTVLINNTWFRVKWGPNREYLGESDDFENSINSYIQKNQKNIDNVFVYCLVDPAWSKPEYPSENFNFEKIGYYSGQHSIDFWSIIVDRYFSVDQNLNISGDQIDVPFMCLNGKPHPHREQLVSQLIEKKLIERGFVSFGGNERIPKITVKENYQKVEGVNNDPYDALTLGDIDNWNKHFLNVVTETVGDVEQTHFWSEKIFKPILGYKPFVVYTPGGMKQILGEMGFEHYCDDFSDIAPALDLSQTQSMAEFLDILSQHPASYFKHKYKQLKEKIKHNRNQFDLHVKSQFSKIHMGFELVEKGNYVDNSHEILNAIYGNNNKKHPKINTLDISIREYFPVTKLDRPLSADKKNIIANYEYSYYDYRKILKQPGNYGLSGSIINDMQENECFYPWHLQKVADNNQQKPIDIPDKKLYFADILLGIPKHHRVDLFEKIKQHPNIFDRSLINLTKASINQDSRTEITYTSPQLLQYEDPRIAKTKTNPGYWHSMSLIKLSDQYNQPPIPASQLIPSKIYDNCWISVVAETYPNSTSEEFFPTEKIAKPIAAGRIFLVSGSRGYLKHLRSLGFRTFEHLIDESYDDLSTVEERNTALVDQLVKLYSMDLSELYREALPILQHNQELLYSRRLMDPVKNFIEHINNG